MQLYNSIKKNNGYYFIQYYDHEFEYSTANDLINKTSGKSTFRFTKSDINTNDESDYVVLTKNQYNYDSTKQSLLQYYFNSHDVYKNDCYEKMTMEQLEQQFVFTLNTIQILNDVGE